MKNEVYMISNDMNKELNSQIENIENEIEQENKSILKNKSLLKKVKRNLKNKYTFLLINNIFVLYTIFLTCSLSSSVLFKIIFMLLCSGTFTVFFQSLAVSRYGTFSENNKRKNDIPFELAASNEKIKVLEENLEIIKENMKSNEVEDFNEQEYDQSLIMYPERDSVIRIDNYMTSGSKIKKMNLNHKYRETTK